MREPPAQSERSIGELLQNLAAETSLLVRQEIELVRAEFSATLKASAKPATLFASAGIFALGAFGVFTAFLVLAIGAALPLWASALIVTLLYAVTACLAITMGRKAISGIKPIPTETISTIKENIRTVRSGFQRGR